MGCCQVTHIVDLTIELDVDISPEKAIFFTGATALAKRSLQHGLPGMLHSSG